MIPTSLQISGFLSYREPVRIDFSTFQVACITGPNGSGKSSILDAITWALFGQARTRDESIINSFSETAAVDFVFEYENIEYRVQRSNTRGKSTVLEFQIRAPEGGWKPLTERTMRKTEQRIVETLRLEYETFVNASFFLQGKADQFTQQRPSDRKRILTNILGLEIWEEYRQRAWEARREREQHITSIDGRLAEINAELAEEKNRKAVLKDLNQRLSEYTKTRETAEENLRLLRKQKASIDQQQQALDQLNQRIQRSDQNLTGILNTLTEREKEQSQAQALIDDQESIQANFEQLKSIRAEIKQSLEQSEEYHALSRSIQEQENLIGAEQARLETELKALKEEEKQVGLAQEQVGALEQQITLVQKEIEALEKVKLQKEKDAQELLSLNKMQGEISTQNRQLKLEMDELKDRINQLEQTTGAECPLCGQPLSEEDRLKLLEELKTEGTSKGDLWRGNRAQLKDTDEAIEKLEQKVQSYKNTEAEFVEKTGIRQHLDTSRQQLLARIETWQKEGLAKLDQIAASLETNRFAAEARQDIQQLQAAISELAYDQEGFKQLQKQEIELEQFEARMQELESARAARQPLIREIETLNKQKESIEKELTQDKKNAEKQTAVIAVQLAEIGDLQHQEREFFQLKEKENQVRLEVGAAQQNVNVLDQLRERKTSLNAEREEQGRLVSKYKALEKAFGKNGIPALLIEQALPQIEEAANEILSRLSNGSMFIKFVTQEKYKDKKRDDMRETLDIQIQDGAGQRDYEMYSGGEAFKINFAIRMALSEVLAQRAGARLQTLVIDEGFGSQDEQGRQRLIEAINIIKDDFEKILVITHIDALKDAFAHQIRVSKNERGSMVELY